MQYQKKKACMNGFSIGLRTTLALASVLLTNSVLASGQDADMKWSQDPSTKCSFVAPASLKDASKFWIGPCPGGKAAGFGMIRGRTGSEAGNTFYGEVRDGVPIIGVVDQDGSYRAGAFSSRDIGEGDSEGQEIRDSFEVAVRAAREVSEHYSREKNTASADHYRAVAQQLDSQLDRD